MATKYLTAEEVIYLNAVQVKKFSPGETIEVLYPNLLDIALSRPKQSVMGEDAYKSIYSKSAALYQSIAQNHCFASANKRTSNLVTFIFLYKNGYELMTSNREMVDFTLKIVQHDVNLDEISDWLKRNLSQFH
ncbi:type II toxin-antitoxin system death-on-curing family toxin [Geomicrobium sp. JCM 19055]|uniref:type II toxin-antitoxin system death-on-curing family toxin n=1 Tax=Geomicrobium sp. JCM 19055 TaxID=1460649 RepID=UPI00045EDBF8|nr:type II toxin-antitoxin system death-on-curing family toxin [Geomicrobium sp. JCM 19055]GAJ99799.1 death on curing protein, Doc toxin [Geomicrobium sp. JCM 19055]